MTADPDTEPAVCVSRLTTTGRPFYAYFDEMGWPMANAATGDVEYTLRYGHPTRSDLLIAASVLAAYRELVHCPRAKRESVVRRLREAERLYPCEPVEE